MTVPVAQLRVVSLGAAEIDEVMDLELRAFDPNMQASRTTILKRFSLGHWMLGAMGPDGLVGTIGFSAIRFFADEVDNIPDNFKEHSTQPVPPDADTTCLYSIGIAPEARGFGCAKLLIHSAFQRGQDEGLSKAIADGPVPSFNGNAQVRHKPELRRAIERYAETGEFPPDEVLLQDPVLSLYTRLSACRFIRMLPNFMPEDDASGGWRVLLYKEY